MRFPRVQVSVRWMLITIALFALAGTCALQERELRRIRPDVDWALNYAQQERVISHAARREVALRSIFGDLGLAILRDGEKVEILRVVKPVESPQVPEVATTGRTLDRPFVQRFSKVIIEEAEFDILDDFPNPWAVGFRIWRRDERIEVFYERNGGSNRHMDVQVIVRDWKDGIAHDSGYWHCISHSSLGDLIKEIEGGLKDGARKDDG